MSKLTKEEQMEILRKMVPCLPKPITYDPKYLCKGNPVDKELKKAIIMDERHEKCREVIYNRVCLMCFWSGTYNWDNMPNFYECGNLYCAVGYGRSEKDMVMINHYRTLNYERNTNTL